MKRFGIRNPVDLRFGPGVLQSLGEVAPSLGKKALVVTGTGSARKTGVLQKVVDLLARAGVESVSFEKATPNPLSTTVDEGVALLKAEGCDFVVGIGGGSPVDVAKAIALCAASGGRITDYQPGGVFADTTTARALPVVAIVTTAGTGTEIDRYLVITNAETQEKPGIGFDCTYPAVGIVDPELMLSVPADVTADTGVDVLFHAMEAYLSTGAQPFSDLLAVEAIRLVVANLERVLAAGHDLEGRTNMAWASTLAGWAIDLGGTVAIHGAGHPVSGRLGATHGQSLAALAVAYLNQNYDANPERFAVVARLLDDRLAGLPDTEAAAQAGPALKRFLARVGRDLSLRSLGVTPEMIPQLAKDAFATMAGALGNNPRPLTVRDVERLYQESL
ncbi:MAG: iron-containing alcohol dehydrogenase [Chitinophagales bacterium]